MFYRQGTYNVGVDLIVAQLKVTRATLYRHFGDKEGLILAYLQRRHGLVSAELDALTADLAPEAAILAVFDGLIGKTANEAFRGCAFLLAATENPQSAAIQQIARNHKAYLHELFTRIGDGWADDELVEQIFVLYEGALAASVLRPEAHPAKAARATAETILKTRRQQVHGDRP